MLRYFKKVSQNLTAEIFEAVKDKLTKVYHNKFLKPADLAKYVILISQYSNCVIILFLGILDYLFYSIIIGHPSISIQPCLN